MHFRFYFLLLISLFSIEMTAQQKSFEKKGNIISFQQQDKTLKIEFCSPTLFRVRASWNKQFEADEPWMVVKYKWPAVNVTTLQKKDHYLLQTHRVTIKVYTPSLRIDVLDERGNLLSSEGIGHGIQKKEDTVQCTKKLAADEHFFGFGERMDFLDRRNKKLKLNVGRGKGMPHITGAYNILEANYSPIPFFMSTKGYGIFFHTAAPSDWDMGNTKNDSYRFSASGGEMDYYFILGPGFPAILNQYTTITGKSPLLSLFAYGLQVGTYSGGTWGMSNLLPIGM